jgi:hypothetical protein
MSAWSIVDIAHPPTLGFEGLVYCGGCWSAAEQAAAMARAVGSREGSWAEGEHYVTVVRSYGTVTL